MKKEILNVIIAFICISLAGIVAVQYFWIYNAIQVKEAQFDRSVNEALSAVVNKLETREDIAYLKKNLVGDSIHSLVQAFTKDPILALNDKLDSLLKSDENFRPPLPRGNQPSSSNAFQFKSEYKRTGSGHYNCVQPIKRLNPAISEWFYH